MSRARKAQDVAFAEAVARLREVLDARGLVDAAAVAQDVIRSMVRQGWRKVAPRVEDGPLGGQQAATGEQRHQHAEEARRLLEEGRALASKRDDLIAAGVDPTELALPIAPHNPKETQ